MNITELYKKIEEQTELINKLIDIQEKMYNLINPNRKYQKENVVNDVLFNPLSED